MPEEKRLTLRIEQDEFTRLDDLRHARRATWQTILMDLLRKWADDSLSQKDSSHPPVNGDMLTFNPAKLGTDWTEKEAADAQAFIDMRRAHDELSISTLDTLLNRWKLIHGAETAERRNDKRRRA